MKYVLGLFDGEIDVIRQIEDLKVEGYDPSKMTALTKDADVYLTIQNRTEANVETAGPSLKEKVKSIFTREKPVKDALIDFGLSEEDAEKYHEELAKEKVLLVTDEQHTGTV
ncbi:general stress protein [Domibacillus robiginosus]|uniref:general stress protein n=1 Tax=Domibacillus robiginosus TaxID=1071054 RepID=UPI00067DA062|nr:general stress protein [Domibacillus robiginosus]